MNERYWNRRVSILLLALLLPLALLLMFSLRGFVRETILIPLAYLLWIAGILIRSTPQAVFWGLAVLIGLILAMRSLYVAGKAPAPAPEGETRGARRQRVGFWVFQVYLSREGYSRVRFADFFSRLAVEVLAFREQVTPAEAEVRLQQGELQAAPQVLAFLGARRSAASGGTDGLSAWLGRWLSAWKAWLAGGRAGARPDPHHAELEQALRYLEDQLEVKHDV